MADRLPIGPYRIVSGQDGDRIPWYVVPFDRTGRCTGPRTADAAVEEATSGRFTDVVIFSHGWNNTWQQATGHYASFVAGYLDQLGQHPPAGGVRRAMLIGLFWPSKLLVEDADRAPAIAGTAELAAVDSERSEIGELGDLLDDAAASQFYELTQRDAVTHAEAAELASMFLRLLADDQAEIEEDGSLNPDEIAAAWAYDGDKRRERVADLDALGFGTGRPARPTPKVAGLPNALNPREIVRILSLWQMKARAGTVGSRGVSALLGDLAASDLRLHLVGHSFGAKLLLTALCTPATLSPVSSVLLLQPAVSHLCFADQVRSGGRPGGYRRALDRVNLPILSTFSHHDVPLTRFYRLAMRRRRHVGEPAIAAAPGVPPSRYAALGGVGPHPFSERIGMLDVLDPGQPYPAESDAPDVYGVNAGRTISGHGDVSNPSTWWLLSQLMHRGDFE